METPPEAIRELVRLFEGAWHAEVAPEIATFVAAHAGRLGGNEQRILVVSLVRVDLEYRWKAWTQNPTAGKGYVLEEYAHRITELGDSDTWPDELIVAEYRARWRWGDRPDTESFLNRFPSRRENLIPLLLEIRRKLQQAETAAPDDKPRPAAPVAPGSIETTRGVSDIPGYEIIAELGRGGMGVVYKARQTQLNRLIALKMVLGDRAGREAAARFLAEAAAVAAIKHPNVVQVYDYGEYAGVPYIALEFCPNGSLITLLKKGRPFTPNSAVARMEKIARGVASAHAEGIVHRDLKPHNVLLDEAGEPKVADFGLAKRVGGLDMTRTGAIVGTPAYMAPEQADGGPNYVGPPADVWALGVVLYQCLTGRLPFQADSVGGLRSQILRDAPTSLRERIPGLPRDLELICGKCLEKKPADRYPTAKELADDLQRFREGKPISVRPAGLLERGYKWAKRKPAAAAAYGLTALVVALLVVGGGAFALWEDKRATDRTIEALKRDANEARLEGERDAESRNKANQAQEGVATGLTIATSLRKQHKFKASQDALAQAMVLAKGGVPERVPEVERAQRDLAFVVALDDIRFRKWAFIAESGGKGQFNTKIAPPEYRRAFAERGLNLMELEPTEVAKRFTASAIRAELVAAVDDWALHEPDEKLRNRLLAITRRADPGDWSDRLRDPTVRNDGAALAKLATVADAVKTPPATLSLLATLMEYKGLDPAPLLSVARAKNPTDFELAFALGQWYHADRKRGRQIGPYEAARALRPDSIAVLNNLGTALSENGDADGAIAALKEVILLNPKFAIAHSNLGNTLEKKGDADGAIAAFREAIRLDPKYAAAHNNLGVTLYNKSELVAAIIALREAIQIDSRSAIAHSNLGCALHGQGDLDGAIAAHKQAIALEFRSAAAHNNLGSVLLSQGDADGAIAAFKQAVSIDSAEAVSWSNLGAALHQKKHYDAALNAHNEAVRLAPWSAQALTNLGITFKAKGNVGGAIAAYKEALKHNSKYALAHYNLGLALTSKGDVDGAIGAYKEAIKHAPTLALAHYYLGIALDDKGDVGGAIAAYQEATKYNPKHALAHYNLGVVLQAKGDVEGAIAAYAEAVKYAPKDAIAHTNLGVLYAQKGKYPEAIACAREATKADPKFPNAHLLLGRLLVQTGDISGGRAALTEATRLDKRWAGVLAQLPPLPVAPAPRPK